MSDMYYVYLQRMGKWHPVEHYDDYHEGLHRAQQYALRGAPVRLVSSHQGLLYQGGPGRLPSSLEVRVSLTEESHAKI